MVKSQKGMSLLELLISGFLAGIVILATSQLYRFMTESVEDAHEKYKDASSLHIISNNLQKYVTSGDTRFFAFSGVLAAADRLVRAVVPLPRKCADLSGSCNKNSSLFYIQYDKAITPSLSAICAHANNRILIDLNNPSYGTAEFSNDIFDVGVGVGDPTLVRGKVTLTRHTVMALMDPPNSILWRATQDAERLIVNYFPATSTFVPPLPADCVARLQPDVGAIPYKLDKLYEVRVRPFKLRQFTNENHVFTTSEIRDVLGQFPKRLFVPQMRTAGLLPTVNGDYKLGVSACSATNNAISCSSDPLFWHDGVTSLNLEYSYRLPMTPANFGRYEILEDGADRSPACQSPMCSWLRVADVDQLRIRRPSENAAYLESNEFSLIKQEALKRIGFRVTGTGRATTFYVNFR